MKGFTELYTFVGVEMGGAVMRHSVERYAASFPIQIHSNTRAAQRGHKKTMIVVPNVATIL